MLRAYFVENTPFANFGFLPPNRQLIDSGNVFVTSYTGVNAAVNRARKKLCLADAKAFVSHGDYDNALQAFEQAMLLASPGPRTQPLNNRSGDEPVNNPGRLRKVYKQAAQHDDVSVHELALDLFLHFKDLENALAACDTLLSLDAKNAQLYGKKADILSEMKRFDQAQPYYRAAIALGSQDIQFYIKEGNLLMSAQKYQGALDRYRSASVIDPRNVQVHRNMAQAFSYLNDFNQALKSCELASSLAPGNPYIYNAKGKILFQLQRFIEALAAFEEAIRLKDDYAVAYENKGDTLQKLANIAYEQAKKIRAGEKRA